MTMLSLSLSPQVESRMINNWYGVVRPDFPSFPLEPLSLTVVRTHLLWCQIWRSKKWHHLWLYIKAVRKVGEDRQLGCNLFPVCSRRSIEVACVVAASALNTRMHCKEIPPSKRGDEKIWVFFLSCVSKHRDCFEMRADHTIETYSLNSEPWDGGGNVTWEGCLYLDRSVSSEEEMWGRQMQ